ncbi:GNAT family N-acetyltransferase [Thermobispora bispora]|uniref:Polysaccharide biosynthesis protein CelD n=1 Tax=Thermobispora bispora (strain ATCC 19993 / DSM 43833 / CBS 139.67 / JCM 10125 / KCTC 9307 / NBRC 14880 / R51) TaxID=469371 RepID=D6Y1N4_THEBD|nr:GNAT family N-acetyltransferase [Thermobispora bispora]ADG88640.1 polysaccharide biosynthesis protein CelD [Thermobispora bispora DSM 43833]MBX6166414.1 GNAT family N-acetyltransferase [Thermobispora bispora]MDI9581526.1 GNAT family N-acetyltransferase [Thermobispora sp.]
MRISVVHPKDLGEPELARWREFQAADPEQDNPFLCPEFVQTVGLLRPQVRVAVIADGSGIWGFFPYERHPLGIGRPVAAGLTDLQGMVYARGLELDAVGLLRATGLAVWEFDHLHPGQPMFAPHHESRHPSPIIELAGGYDEYLATLRRKSPTTYRMTRYKRNRLGREVGEVRHVAESTDTAALRRVMHWKSQQYRRTGRMDRFAHPWIVELVERLHAIRTDRFAGSLSLLYAGDELVAGHFGLRTGSQLCTWFPAYDTRFGKYSPGLLQHLAMAQDFAAAGLRHIDMGRGPKDYKEQLKTRDLEVAEGRVARASAGAAVHWVAQVPLRRLRNAVVSTPFLRDRADRLLKVYGRLSSRLRPVRD